MPLAESIGIHWHWQTALANGIVKRHEQSRCKKVSYALHALGVGRERQLCIDQWRWRSLWRGIQAAHTTHFTIQRLTRRDSRGRETETPCKNDRKCEHFINIIQTSSIIRFYLLDPFQTAGGKAVRLPAALSAAVVGASFPEQHRFLHRSLSHEKHRPHRIWQRSWHHRVSLAFPATCFFIALGIYNDLQGSTRIYGLFHYSLLHLSVKERYYNCEIQRAQGRLCGLL